MSRTKKPKCPPLLSELPLKEQVGHFTILLENIETHVQTIAENQMQMEERLNRKMDTSHHELKTDILLTQQALRTIRDDLKSDIKNVDQKLMSEIQRVEQKLTNEIQRVDRNLSSVEKNLSLKIDSMTEVVGKHEGEIQILKRASL